MAALQRWCSSPFSFLGQPGASPSAVQLARMQFATSTITRFCYAPWGFLPLPIARDSDEVENLSLAAVSCEENIHMGRRCLATNLVCTSLISAAPASALAVPEKKIKGKKSPFDEQRLLEQNRRMQKLNNAPDDFPGFVREGYNVKIVTSDQYVKCDSGLIYLDIREGHGDSPKDGQQVTFHYTGYNESGGRVDSTYQRGQPARTRVGIKAMIPGFEEGLRSMKLGGKRRMIVPPELGPPVGPSTFFSAKQFEVFDVELLDAKDCTRRTIGFYSDFVCD